MHRSTRKGLSERINSSACRARFPWDARTMLRLGADARSCRSWLFKSLPRKNACTPSSYFPRTRNRRSGWDVPRRLHAKEGFTSARGEARRRTAENGGGKQNYFRLRYFCTWWLIRESLPGPRKELAGIARVYPGRRLSRAFARKRLGKINPLKAVVLFPGICSKRQTALTTSQNISAENSPLPRARLKT